MSKEQNKQQASKKTDGDEDKGDREALVVWLDEVNMKSVKQVGGKNASLGEMIQSLKDKDVLVPMGFATTAYAYRYFIRSTNIEEKLKDILSKLDEDQLSNLKEVGEEARNLIKSVEMPDNLKQAIGEKYRQLCEKYKKDIEKQKEKERKEEGLLQKVKDKVSETLTTVIRQNDKQDDDNNDIYILDCAVRSSATAEDLPEASFAGQQESYLNIRGVDNIVASVHECYSSLFTDRAISYRVRQGFDQMQVALSVRVMRMVRSDKASAGVIFTLDTESGFNGVVFLSAAYGLGENVVQGSVNVDEWYVFKETLKNRDKDGKRLNPIIKRKLGSKEKRMIYTSGGRPGEAQTKNIDTTIKERQQYSLQNDEIIKLADWACIIEDHYSKINNKPTPMDIEFAKDGLTGELWIVQARPETVQSQKAQLTTIKTYKLNKDNKQEAKVLATGRSVARSISKGKAKVLTSVSESEKMESGDILVAPRTDPDWSSVMKKAVAIVTDQGGRTSYAAIISREMDVPAIVGCGTATKQIKSGTMVTVVNSEGDEGKVYEGELEYDIIEHDIKELPKLKKTQVYMNLASPDSAFGLAKLPIGGIGLVRIEFTISSEIKVHPLALVHYSEIKDAKIKKEIDDLTMGYDDDNKKQYFIDKLSEAIATIAAAFYPRPVIVRLSDFKTNEYKQLLGGELYEPDEANPMLGWRGCSRYYDDKYAAGFALECASIKRARDEMGFTNLIPMVPVCRTVDEGRKVVQTMEKNGLKRGVNNLQVYMMAELPSNVMLAEEFCQIFDGFSIGSNDLTQMTLGIERDNEHIAHLKIGLCGEAPSNYPDFAKFLFEQEIDTMSINTDAVLNTILLLGKIEAGEDVSKIISGEEELETKGQKRTTVKKGETSPEQQKRMKGDDGNGDQNENDEKTKKNETTDQNNDNEHKDRVSEYQYAVYSQNETVFFKLPGLGPFPCIPTDNTPSPASVFSLTIHENRPEYANIQIFLKRAGLEVSTAGRTALVIGFGMIEQSVADSLRANSYTVSILDSSAYATLNGFTLGYKTGTKIELLQNADIISSATAQQFLSYEDIMDCKNNAVLKMINNPQLPLPSSTNTQQPLTTSDNVPQQVASSKLIPSIPSLDTIQSNSTLFTASSILISTDNNESIMQQSSSLKAKRQVKRIVQTIESSYNTRESSKTT
ncbi:unnamed protein product [Didymodactylos carnosus]|uniref:pyruvate, water dikinase n=1 Tax=Didymodactylos carnosus TaxID=1234261 RepID=A0A8S2HNS6_9BILA|nr:unnamed protein product [Didymodactylos carnosus]CAF3663730.1 unnamed protein product [Didymodactylos carnosus]